ncbi:HAMP domain-containing histidine kinase [Actinospica durhamensis]|uniref:histidine kinase n=1 Tax=Actinospica durhamensis TaxID=1508375 RepID=A0A941EYC3_9ACTN|nr:HAMP domain-containing sensor histidine kinase [Actinospica durhamensis]MBR7837294.1 HAMP domain-containing histidine kinase [Actinospica durhamensis]
MFFSAAALEVRHLAYDQQMSQARSDARQEADAILAKLQPNGWVISDLQTGKYPYEMVSSQGLLASSSQLKPFEDGGHKSLMPQPPTVSGQQIFGSTSVTFPRTAASAGSALAGRTLTAQDVLTEVDGITMMHGVPLAYAYPGTRDFVAVRAYVFVTPDAAEAAENALDRVLYPGVPAAALLVAAVAYVATRRALRPVEQITARTAAVTASDPRERVTVPATGDEIARLATAINSTLERLEAASRTQHRFVADAAHELRSPLASLLATLEVAEKYPAKADWPAAVRTAAGQTRRLRALADDLLLLARLDTAPQTSGNTSSAASARAGRPVDLAALVQDVASDFEGRRVAVSVQDDSLGAATVEGNAVRLERMLRNLVDNAVRFADAAVVISVAVDDGQAVVTVSDDGPGIAPADRERVFDRFTRLQDDRARATGGSGLGLAIAREIADRHHGSLRVLEPVGGGATLAARLPVARQQA